MDQLNENYNDILKALNMPNITIKEIIPDREDNYFTMRNEEDISITLRMKNTLFAIIAKHYKNNKQMVIYFIRSSYDIVGDGSNTLDAFYYVRYEAMKPTPVFKTKGTFNEQLQSANTNKNLTFSSVNRAEKYATLDIGGPIDSSDASFDIIAELLNNYTQQSKNLIVDISGIFPNALNNSYRVHFHYKYIEQIDKKDVGYQHKGLCNEKPFPSKLKTEDITKSSTTTLSFGLPMSSNDYVRIYGQNNLCPERYNNKISLLNDRFNKINPFAVGLRFETLKYSELRTIFVKGEFKDSNDLDLEIISQICNLYNKEDNDLIIDICSINISDPLKITYRVCFRHSHVKRAALRNVMCTATNISNKLAYVDYPTANFYQIETICPIDELDYWKAIGEEILSMDDVDEAVKFHKQFYHSKQKFRLVKIQKQLLGDV